MTRASERTPTNLPPTPPARRAPRSPPGSPPACGGSRARRAGRRRGPCRWGSRRSDTFAPARFSARAMARLCGGREQPVGGERHQQEPRLRAAEGSRKIAAAVRGQVEVVHRPRDRQVGVRVEPVDEGAALVAQVALHLEHVAEQADRLGSGPSARSAAGGRTSASAPASDR